MSIDKDLPKHDIDKENDNRTNYQNNIIHLQHRTKTNTTITP
jgi:hypothetical protein